MHPVNHASLVLDSMPDPTFGGTISGSMLMAIPRRDGFLEKRMRSGW